MNVTKTFRDLEHEGWSERAATYDDAVGRVTAGAVEPILETFGDLAGKRLLDVACGPGRLAGAAARRGAFVNGVDFAAPMVQAAETAYPNVEFEEADAERLPFADAYFDAVSCAFGLLHFEHAERAVAEARRVLKRGGRYTFCVWRQPDGRGSFFELALGAIERHGTTSVSLPPAPPFFRFADPLECRRVLTSVGFAEPTSRIVDLSLRLARADELLRFIERGTVRMMLVLVRQGDAARNRIERAIVEGAEAYGTASGIELRLPAVVTSAVVP